MKDENQVARQSLRSCWNAPDLHESILYHGWYNHEFMAHSHDVLTFILVTGGAVRIDVDETSHTVGKGQFVAIGAHQVHAARPLDGRGWRMRSLHLHPGTLARSCGLPAANAGNLRFHKPVHAAGTPIGSLFFDIHYCSQVDGAAGERGDRFGLFLDWLSQNLDVLGPQTVGAPCVDERAELARKILAETLFENVSLNELAGEVGMSPFALIRNFKKSFGICPHTWRLQERANEVARLLRSRVSLVEAAGACGFSDQSHMARVFKKVFGVTPGQYRAMGKLSYLH